MEQNRLKGFLILFGGTVCLSTVPVVSKLVLQEVPHLHFSATWMLSASLWAALWAFGVRGKEARRAIETSWQRIILAGFFATGFVFFYFAGLERLDPAVSTFLVNSRMVWALAIGMLFLGERYSPLQLTAMLVVAAGVVVVYMDAPAAKELLGMVFVVCSALFFVLMNIVVKRGIAKSGVAAILLGRFVFPTLALLPISIAGGSILPHLTIRSLLLIMAGSFIGPFMSFLLVFTALRYLELGIHTIFQSLGIVLSTALTFLVFGTVPAANRLAGGTLVVIGIVLLGLVSLRRGTPSGPPPVARPAQQGSGPESGPKADASEQ